MAVTTSVASHFANLLHYLESRLSQLEDFNRRWDELGSEDKDDLITEWPIVEDRIADLQELVQRHGVPGDHRKRCDQLMERISRDRPILESLRERP